MAAFLTIDGVTEDEYRGLDGQRKDIMKFVKKILTNANSSSPYFNYTAKMIRFDYLAQSSQLVLKINQRGSSTVYSDSVKLNDVDMAAAETLFLLLENKLNYIRNNPSGQKMK